MLKYAGYDALVLTGAADEPLALLIEDGQVELKPAEHLWGLNISETSRVLHEEFGDGWQSLSIGPPGEKLRNLAGIFNDTSALARGGVGAVMGSKNLKTILVRGSGLVKVHDPQRYNRALQLAFRAVRMSSETTLLNQEGTVNILEIIDVIPTIDFAWFTNVAYQLTITITLADKVKPSDLLALRAPAIDHHKYSLRSLLKKVTSTMLATNVDIFQR